MTPYVYETRWRNIGVWVEPMWPDAGLKTPWGNLIVKPWSRRLFSERYGYTKTVKLGPLCITWVRLRRYVH